FLLNNSHLFYFFFTTILHSPKSKLFPYTTLFRSKDEGHRTSYIMNDKYEILDVQKDSNLFLFFTRIQEEVHRYAITYHRNIKSKGMLSSVLDVVPGIGEVRKKELLKHFGSLKKLREASIEELSSVVSREVAENLKAYLKEI